MCYIHAVKNKIKTTTALKLGNIKFVLSMLIVSTMDSDSATVRTADRCLDS